MSDLLSAYLSNVDSIVRWMSRRGIGKADAMDAIHDAVVLGIQKGLEDATPWLWATAKRVVLSNMRRRRERIANHLEFCGYLELQPSRYFDRPDVFAENSQNARQLHGALSSLKPNHRVALVARWFDESDVASALQIDKVVASDVLRNATDTLYRRLGGEGRRLPAKARPNKYSRYRERKRERENARADREQ